VTAKPAVNHFAIFSVPAPIEEIAAWLRVVV